MNLDRVGCSNFDASVRPLNSHDSRSLKHSPWESKASARWRGLLAVAEEIPALRNVDLVRLDQRTDDQRVEIIELRLREDFVTELKRAGIQLLAEIRTVILPSGSSVRFIKLYANWADARPERLPCSSEWPCPPRNNWKRLTLNDPKSNVILMAAFAKNSDFQIPSEGSMNSLVLPVC
jgi:hypothetical protein